MATNPSPTLASVQQHFADWRRTRSNLKTPLPLKEQAVGLLTLHGMGEVCKGLNINHDMLKRWRRERPAAPTESGAFVELPVAALPTALTPPGAAADERLDLTLTHESADGSTLSLSGQLSPAQWRWAVQLLRPHA